jgi:hypothetical protein
MRYATATTKKTTDGKRYLESLIIPVVPVTAADTYIVVTSTERLDKLAQSFYGDSSMWWVIATANGIGKGSIVVPPETRLRIPDAARIQEIINNVNSTR